MKTDIRFYHLSLIFSFLLLRMRNVSHKLCRENQNTHFEFSDFLYFFFENRGVYGIMWKKYCRGGVGHM